MSTPSLLAPPAETDLKSHLKGLDHSDSGKWHTLGAPAHLSLYPTEGTLVAPFAKSLTEELTPFLEEYFWRVDNSSQADLFAAMFTPTGTYYHSAHRFVLAGHGDFAAFGAGMGHGPPLRESIWLRHRMDRVAVLPSVEEGGSVLVHVLGTHWNGKTETKERAEQGEETEVGRAARVEFPFSETFEVVKVGGEWKIQRIILMMHDEVATLMRRK
jgi:membrane protein implicated in regulation of membrane protease activity